MDKNYEGREQSATKHQILSTYLQALAFKVGQAWHSGLTINYLDAFAGPWESRSDTLDDTSPGIALQTLLEVRESLRRVHNKHVAVRALFVSRSTTGVKQLQQLAARYPAAHVQIEQGTFEEVLPAAESFVRQGANPFAFLFIDPTGWTGFPMQKITLLL